MPKSKRNKIVHLTQVKKKSKDHKGDLMKQLEQLVDQHQRVFLFDLNETKSDRIMNLRVRLKEHGRIFAGRNSLVSVTLKSIGRRTRTNYASLVGQIAGHRGLFFTNLECDKLIALLEKEQAEFRNKLLGYAQLKATDDNTEGDDQEASDDDEDGQDEDEASDGAEAPSKGPRRRVVFKPIEKCKASKRKAKKSGASKIAAGETPMETR